MREVKRRFNVVLQSYASVSSSRTSPASMSERRISSPPSDSAAAASSTSPRPRPRRPPLRLEPGRPVNDRRPAASATASHPLAPPLPRLPPRREWTAAAPPGRTRGRTPRRMPRRRRRMRKSPIDCSSWTTGAVEAAEVAAARGGAMTCLHTGQHARFVISHGSMQSLWNACPQPSARNSSPLS